MKTCQHCAGPMPYRKPQRGRPPLYCSRRCRKRAEYSKKPYYWLSPEYKTQRLVNLASDEMLARWEDLGLYACIYCDAPFEEVEHSIPKSRAAEFGFDPSHPENLVPACRNCNRGPGGKHSQTPAQWRPEAFQAMYDTVMEARRFMS